MATELLQWPFWFCCLSWYECRSVDDGRRWSWWESVIQPAQYQEMGDRRTTWRLGYYLSCSLCQYVSPWSENPVPRLVIIVLVVQDLRPVAPCSVSQFNHSLTKLMLHCCQLHTNLRFGRHSPVKLQLITCLMITWPMTLTRYCLLIFWVTVAVNVQLILPKIKCLNDIMYANGTCLPHTVGMM